MAIERRQRRRRNGETYFIWRVRWTNEAGVKRASTFDSERDASDFEARLRLLRRSRQLASLDAGRETLSEFVQEWWKLEASSRLERATLKGYASHWNRHMLPRLGQLPLREITPLRVTRFRAELEQAGVGDETIRRCLVVLQGILARAVEWQRIGSNPLSAVRKPRTRRTRAVTPLAPSAVEALRQEMLARGGSTARRCCRCSPSGRRSPRSAPICRATSISISSAQTASTAARSTSGCSSSNTRLTTSSIVILSAPAIAGASLLVVAVESPTIMDAAVAGTTLSASPSEPLLHQP